MERKRKKGSSDENCEEFTETIKTVNDLMKEGSPGENHGEFTGVVGVVVPGVVLGIPGVEATRKPHHPVPLLPPDSVTQQCGGT